MTFNWILWSGVFSLGGWVYLGSILGWVLDGAAQLLGILCILYMASIIKHGIDNGFDFGHCVFIGFVFYQATDFCFMQHLWSALFCLFISFGRRDNFRDLFSGMIPGPSSSYPEVRI